VDFPAPFAEWATVSPAADVESMPSMAVEVAEAAGSRPRIGRRVGGLVDGWLKVVVSCGRIH
jgi:hypothetical protein